MGHLCRICGKVRANEKFSGKGHKNHICKDCSKKPAYEIKRIDREEEIFGFLRQSNISKKNITRLNTLIKSDDSEISELASIVLEVAIVKPHKRKRLNFLRKENRELLAKLKSKNLIETDYW